MRESANTGPESRFAWISTAGFALGPLLALVMLVMPPPEGMGKPAWAVAALAVLMSVWWMTEAAPLAATALIPLIFFPLLGIGSLGVTAESYAHPLIFLFLGGFLLAQAMQHWRLSEHIALRLLRLSGTGPRAIIASFMGTTAFLSMWISNTATAMMMLPIGCSIVASVSRCAGRRQRKDVAPFATSLMLGIGYAASIGGMGTLIGTPPNALFANFVSIAFAQPVSFLDWMMVGIPAVVLLLPIAWFVLTHVAFQVRLAAGPELAKIVDREIKALGPLNRGQKILSVLLVMTALGWIGQPLIEAALPSLGLTDSGIALAAALALFIIPVNGGKGDRLLTWEVATHIRWDVLILFGGGIALATAVGLSGLASWLGGALSALGVLPLVLLILGVAAIIVFLGELASNTAVAATFLPVAGATAAGIGADPMLLTVPVALAASIGFMLPVATPPNAIVYGSGVIPARDMLRAGFLIDLAGIAVTALVTLTIATRVFS
ncbi:MAG: DASS family sodium-coupled anion symporter [Pseudomonadota bacterium]|nr:DASS family sodium-coupled anion symporter [Pseudomonadota bacterium]